MRVLHFSPIWRTGRREWVWRAQASWLASLTILVAGLFASVLAPAAGATELGSAPTEPTLTEATVAQPASATKLGYSLTPSKTEPFAVCPTAKPGESQCMAIVEQTAATRSQAEAEARLGRGPEPAASPSLEGTGEEGGFTPAEIRKAYGIPETGGSEQTVAIVDAFNDPDAESDLQKYREKYKVYYKGTETACTEANKCFKKVDQTGETEKEAKEKSKAFPENEPHWSQEISLDLDMVSATCPECKILLVEATTNKENAEKVENLYLAENEAVALKATEVSNSWGGPEESTETSDDKYFDHEGVPITAGAGDSGYGVSYPAASPDVISVGGTTLKKTKEGRGWEESVWGDSGGGCSVYEKSKPGWQHDPGCTNRMDNDVAAVASLSSPVSVYDSYEYDGLKGWLDFGGTSVGTPIVAAVEAHASKAVREEKGAEAFYRHTLFNVTSGSNGVCGHTYLCEAAEGYNGPTGWGTPDGPLELTPKTSAITEAATSVTSTGAKLNGYVYTAGLSTSYHFEYGPTTSYGTTVPVPEGKVGTGVMWQGVSQSIAGLHTLAGTYHYRLVATNSSGTVYGADHTFTTIPWVVQMTPYPSPSESDESRLEGVSCSSLTACTAVSSYAYKNETRLALIEGWNGTEWKIQSTPKPTGATYVWPYGVSCTSSTACTAVGFYINSSEKQVPLAERWNGTEWSVQTIPNPTEAKVSYLYGVSCISSTECIAVGSYTNSSDIEVPLAERWNGTEWSVQATPTPAGAKEEISLSGVSCSSSTACTAVGSYTNSSSIVVPLAERWNGTAWSIQSTPSPEGAKASSLSTVSCTSSSACTAIGRYTNSSSTEVPLAERWNGTAWSIQSTPSIAGASLRGVSCPSSTECIAIGSAAGAPLSERWNGTEWSVEATALPEEAQGFADASLSGISCLPSKACTAVGAHIGRGEGGLGDFTPLAERRAIPKPYVETKPATSIGVLGATLNGIVNPESSETKYYFEYGTTESYGSKTAEVSAGAGTSNVEESKAITGLEPGTTYHFRVVATNGGGTADGADRAFTTTAAWQIASTPNPTGATESYLGGFFFEGSHVSCSSSTACTAVGYDRNSSGTDVTLAERWNGTEWSIQSTPNPTGAKESRLLGVSCPSSTACTAVGYDESSSGGTVTLAERWNGSEWSIQSTPNITTGEYSTNILSAVACSSSTACTAVGWYFSTSPTVTLAERWNGTEWSVQSTPKPTGAKYSWLFSDSCSSSTACTAAGLYENSSGTRFPLVEHWNGTEWSIQSTPSPSGAIEAGLVGVSCYSSTVCTAVGEYENSSGTYVTLAERWNGTEWSIQSTPNPSGSTETELGGVSCYSSTVCMAVGWYKNSSGAKFTLAERWNGTEWSIQSTPNPSGATEATLGSVSCSSLTTCTAVGHDKNSSGTDVTLAEIYNE